MTSPIHQQYLSIKEKYPDAVVLFRVGDFYEAFDDDAELIATDLRIALTYRKVEEELAVSIHHHDAGDYIARLIKAGYNKVIVAE